MLITFDKRFYQYVFLICLMASFNSHAHTVGETAVESNILNEIDRNDELLLEDKKVPENDIDYLIKDFKGIDGIIKLDSSDSLDRGSDQQNIIAKSFIFSGNTLVTDAQIQKLINKYLLQQTLSQKDLLVLVKSIEKLYQDEGYMLVDVNLTSSSITNENFLIDIQEKESSIVIDSLSKSDTRWLENFFSKTQDAPINFKKLERELKIFNELPGVSAKAQVIPVSINKNQVKILINEQKKYYGSIGYDNFGARSVGTERLKTNINVNQPLNFGDKLSLTTINSTNELFNLYNIDYSFPLNTMGLRSFIKYLNADYRLGNYLDAAPASNGNVRFYSGGIDYPLILEKNYELKLGFSVNKFDLVSFESNQNISNKTRLSNTFFIKGFFLDNLKGKNFFNLQFHDGRVELDNANERSLDQSTSGEDTLGNYQKIFLNYFRAQDITDHLKLDFNYSVQTSSQNLDSSERIRSGGPYAVRAYPTGEGVGTMGYVLNTDLKYYFNKRKNLITTGSIFYDISSIHKYNNHYSGLTNNQLTLKGWGLAFYHKYNDFVIKGTWSKRLADNPDPNNNGDDHDNTKKLDRFWLMTEYHF